MCYVTFLEVYCEQVHYTLSPTRNSRNKPELKGLRPVDPWQQLHPENKREVCRLVSGELEDP